MSQSQYHGNPDVKKTLERRGVKFGKERTDELDANGNNKYINVADASEIAVGIDTLGKLDYLIKAENFTVTLPRPRQRIKPLRIH